jgi:hypothetical protein
MTNIEFLESLSDEQLEALSAALTDDQTVKELFETLEEVMDERGLILLIE